MLLGLQLYFGLTLSEAMRIYPGINIGTDCIWMTRDASSYNQSRLIPIDSPQQKAMLEKLIELTGQCNNLIDAHGYDVVRYAYRKAMKSVKFCPRKSYRYFYAQMIYKKLAPTLPKAELVLLMMRQMGLQSRVTLWRYLKE